MQTPLKVKTQTPGSSAAGRHTDENSMSAAAAGYFHSYLLDLVRETNYRMF